MSDQYDILSKHFEKILGFTYDEEIWHSVTLSPSSSVRFWNGLWVNQQRQIHTYEIHYRKKRTEWRYTYSEHGTQVMKLIDVFYQTGTGPAHKVVFTEEYIKTHPSWLDDQNQVVKVAQMIVNIFQITDMCAHKNTNNF